VRSLVAALAVITLSVVGYPAAVVLELSLRQTSPSVGAAWLHVEHPPGQTPYVADSRGRRVLLHGAIPGGLIDYWSGTDPTVLTPPPHYPIDPAAYEGGRCPANSAVIRTPPLCRYDIDEMRALGFDSIRLPISWSLLEPRRGVFSTQYLDRIAQVVSWAGEDGMWVIVDMHQNAYSRYTGRSGGPPLPGGKVPALWDHSGAPPWATITDGFPAEDYLHLREVDPAVLEADSNFWYDREGIQEEYVVAVARVAARFKNDPTVVGYGLFNEPLPGWTVSPIFEDLLLFPFYRRVIDAVTGLGDGLPCPHGGYLPPICGEPDAGVHDRRQIFFLDAGIEREVTDFPTHLGLSVSSYPNLALAIHAYTHVYTFDALIGQNAETTAYPPGGYGLSYSSAEREARAMGAALFVAEFGNEVKDDGLLLTNQLREQERHAVGFAFWTWKENCGSGWGVYAPVVAGGCAYDRPSGQRDTSVKSQNGCLRRGRERLLARVYPVVAPPSYTYSYDPATGAFTMTGSGDPTSVRLEVPPEVSGIRTQERLSHGRYRITIAPAPLRLKGCS
jgi:endoglycosylceramidase